MSGKPREIPSLYYWMRKSNVQENNFTFSSVSDAYWEIRYLQDGKGFHNDFVESEL